MLIIACNVVVSESMAAFLAGEDLSGHVNVDDSIIVNVMNAAERRAQTLASGNLIHSKGKWHDLRISTDIQSNMVRVFHMFV